MLSQLQIATPGKKFGPWTIYKEPQRGKEVFSIKRAFYTGFSKKPRYQRYPAQQYRHLRSDLAQLAFFVEQLNQYPIKKKEIPDFDSASNSLITSQVMQDYLEFLRHQMVSEREARCDFGYVKRHLIHFFMNRLGLCDPVQWLRVHQTKWTEYLLGPDAPKSMHTKRDIVYASNRFLRWLHGQYQTEVPFIKLEPFTKLKFVITTSPEM